MSGEEVVEQNEENSKKYITATLDKNADSELISRYGRLSKIGGFSSRDVFEAGVKALTTSEQYQNAIKSLKEELNEWVWYLFLF